MNVHLLLVPSPSAEPGARGGVAGTRHSYMSAHPFRLVLIIPVLLALAACGGGGQDAAGAPGPGGGMTPMPVQVRRVEPAPVERTSEYIANLKSRRSTTIQ